MTLKQKVGLIAGPSVALVVGLAMLQFSDIPPAAVLTASITVLVIIWWMLEPIPIPVVSLLPLTLLPMCGIITVKDVQQAYGHPLILLLLGGFILSTAMAHSGAHQKIAYSILRVFGGKSGRSLVLGFMATAALLSMWISNTATTLMLLPVALAILDRVNDQRLVAPLLLGTAHAASVGGIGTPIGTPPNVVFLGLYNDHVGDPSMEIDFLQWMTWGIPVVIVVVPLLALWLTRNVNFKTDIQLPDVGNWTTAQKRVLTIFALTACGWVLRKAPFGGWAGLLPEGWHSSDYMVAFFAIVALFMTSDGKGNRLLNWETATKIPWGMLLLFGAGLTIAKAFEASGLSAVLAENFDLLQHLPVLFLILIICLFVTFLTETTSNTATTTILLPILLAAAIAAAVDPKLFMVPAAMSASCAFMLPVATPPNVVVYSSGRFPMEKMAKEGFILNLIGAVVITTACFLYFSNL